MYGVNLDLKLFSKSQVSNVVTVRDLSMYVVIKDNLPIVIYGRHWSTEVFAHVQGKKQTKEWLVGVPRNSLADGYIMTMHHEISSQMQIADTGGPFLESPESFWGPKSHL